MKGAWVLTYECNDYNQHGEYFIALFEEKPSLDRLAAFCARKDIYIGSTIAEGISFLEHLRSGGSRLGDADHWYNLKFVDFEK